MSRQPGDHELRIPLDGLHCQRLGCNRPAATITITLTEAWARSHHAVNSGRLWIVLDDDEPIIDAIPTCKAHAPE